jgi:hypothetical protein
MDWGFIWLMFVLKIPIVALLLIVWWAIRSQPEQSDVPGSDDGGTKRPRRHPRRPFPRSPRRGPHGDPALPPPARVRSVVARARDTDHA